MGADVDAFLLKQVVSELAAELPGALVLKVRQPGEKEIVLELWTGRGEKQVPEGKAQRQIEEEEETIQAKTVGSTRPTFSLW